LFVSSEQMKRNERLKINMIFCIFYESTEMDLNG